MFENGHKIDPLTEDLETLFSMFNEETAEFKKAFRLWQRNRSVKNAKNMMDEGGDIINSVKHIVGVAAGYKSMERR